MPELRGDWNNEVAPCAWCRIPTDVRVDAPDGRRLPLHMLCAAALIKAYNDYRAGRSIGWVEVSRLGRIMRPALGDGGTT